MKILLALLIAVVSVFLGIISHELQGINTTLSQQMLREIEYLEKSIKELE